MESDSDDQHEAARVKATRKSRDLREKLKKRAIAKKTKVEGSSEDVASEEETRVRRGGSSHRQDKAKGRPEHRAVETESESTRKKKKDSKSSSSALELLLSPKTTPPYKPGLEDVLEAEEKDRSPWRAQQPIIKEDCDVESSPPAVLGGVQTQAAPLGEEMEEELTGMEEVLAASVEVEEDDLVLQQRGEDENEEGGEEEVENMLEKEDREEEEGGEEEQGDGEMDIKIEVEVKSPWRTVVPTPVPIETKLHSSRVEDTPQSPIVDTAKSSCSPPPQPVGSDLSSGDYFKEDGSNRRLHGNEKSVHRRKAKKRSGDSEHEIDRRHLTSPVRSSRHRQQTPNFSVDDTDWKRRNYSRASPPVDKPQDGNERGSSRGTGESSRKSRKLPRHYQPEAGEKVMMGGRRDGGGRYRDAKEQRPERQYHGGPAVLSPSPPPHPVHLGRSKYHLSPPSQGHPTEKFDRKRMRGRQYSPGGGGGGGGGGYQRRRSPVYMSPTHRAKSPYGGSSPHR